MQLIGSCVISFAWVALINAVNKTWLCNRLIDDIWVTVAISILLSLITSLIISGVYLSEPFRKFTVKILGISPHSTVWRNIINSNDGALLKVYLKGKDFYWAGSLYSYEENGSESWFCLHKHAKYNMQNEMIYNQKDNEGAYLTFNLKDVESIEIIK